jgi:hypothetical protein
VSTSSSSNVRSAITYVTSSPLGIAESAIVGVPFLLTPFVQTDALEAPGTHGNTTALSASCDGDACTAEPAADHPGTFRITPTKAQATNVNVRVNNSQAGALSGSYPMTFADPASVVIALSAPDIDVDHLLFASLPGAAFVVGAWPAFNGREMAFDGAVTWTTDSDAFALTSDMSDGRAQTLTAVHPGTAHVTMTAGPLTRVGVFTVADVTKATSIALHAAPMSATESDAARAAAKSEIALSQGIVADPVATVDVTGLDVSFAVVITMADGSKAIGGAAQLTPSPPGLVKLESHHHDEIVTVSKQATGKGTISATIGSATLSIPFSVK